MKPEMLRRVYICRPCGLIGRLLPHEIENHEKSGRHGANLSRKKRPAPIGAKDKRGHK